MHIFMKTNTSALTLCNQKLVLNSIIHSIAQIAHSVEKLFREFSSQSKALLSVATESKASSFTLL